MALDLAEYVPTPESGHQDGVYLVRQIPNFKRHYMGRDSTGRVCLLLGSADSGSKASIRLAGLDVQYALDCTVRLSGGAEGRQALTVVTCGSINPDDQRYFCYAMETLVGIVGPEPSLQQISEAVLRLAAIFQRLAAPAREGVVGLVGELVVIASASDPIAAVLAWRTDTDERYDFVQGVLRLEAKSSMRRRRVHRLSFEQCAVPPGCCGILVSVFVEKSAGGTSTEALLCQLRDYLAPNHDALLHLEQTLADTLGKELPEALGFSFDLELATSSLAFYAMQEVPGIRGVLPVGVSQVRFTSDMTGCVAAKPEDIRNSCNDFSAFVPRASLDLPPTRTDFHRLAVG